MSHTEFETAGRPRAARKAPRRKTVPVSEARLTMSIPEAGKRYFGLSKT